MANVLRLWIFCFCFTGGMGELFSQTTEAEVETWRATLQDVNGVEKLKLYHLLIEAKMSEDPAMALRDALRAEALVENLEIEDDDLSLKPKTYLLLGEAYEARNRDDDALKAYTVAITTAAEIEELEMLTQAEAKVGLLASGMSDRKRNRVGKAIGGLFSKTEGGLKDLSLETALRMAAYQEKKLNYPGAIKHYNKAVDRLLDKGDSERADELRLRIEQLRPLASLPPDTPAPPAPPIEEMEIIAAVDDSMDMVEIDRQLNNFIREFELDEQNRSEIEDDAVKDVAVRAVVLDQATKDVAEMAESAKKAEESQDYATSLDYYKQFLALEKELASEQRKQDSSKAEINCLKTPTRCRVKLVSKNSVASVNQNVIWLEVLGWSLPLPAHCSFSTATKQEITINWVSLLRIWKPPRKN